MLPNLGRYETLRKIASGGMATVYLGRVVGEGGFERLVALKVMHPHIASDPDFVGMFLDEARLAAQIRHPNVVATIDIQKTEDAMFLVMDYVDGPTLQEVRKHLKSRDERVPIGIALRFFIDILNGLQEAHELCAKDGTPLHLVHRDVSPHNILIGQDGRAQLTDFGVAKAEARISSTRGGQLKGKIAYMPPEQIIAQPVDRRADIYSAGVCLWECLVGKRLFRAANDGALVHMILDGNPTPPSKYCDDIPAAIEGVLMKAISRRAEERYDEAVDFSEALEDAARESKVKIPRQRSVGQFIKEIVGELGQAPISKRSLTPPSAPSQRSHPINAARNAATTPAPALPKAPVLPSAPSLPKRPPRAAAVDGPPPIPDLGSDPAFSPKKLPRPPKKTSRVSGASPPVIAPPKPSPAKPPVPVKAGPSKPKLGKAMVGKPGTKPAIGSLAIGSPAIGSPAIGKPVIGKPVIGKPLPPVDGDEPSLGAPSAETASVESVELAVKPPPPPPVSKKSVPDVLDRPPIMFDDDTEDPPADVPGSGHTADPLNHSQPSAVTSPTSPTQTEAIYSLTPPPSRHGIIAVAVAGAFLLIVLIAVFSGSPDASTDSAPTPAPFPKPAASTGAKTPPTPTPPPPAPPPATSSAVKTSEPPPTPKPAPQPVFSAPRQPRPTPPPPSPDPAPFKPKGL